MSAVGLKRPICSIRTMPASHPRATKSLRRIN
jgi:hypothetical protein